MHRLNPTYIQNRRNDIKIIDIIENRCTIFGRKVVYRRWGGGELHIVVKPIHSLRYAQNLKLSKTS